MSENVSPTEVRPVCPRCGAAAEIGWLQGGDVGLRWHVGPYSTLKNLFTPGERVGTVGFWTAAHVDANRCPKCRLIWLEY
jgi:Domain of unknown function (DUF6487)